MNDHNLLRYMLTGARISLAQHWKREILPSIQDQETIIKEYEALEKLTVYIYSKSPTKFKNGSLIYNISSKES